MRLLALLASIHALALGDTIVLSNGLEVHGAASEADGRVVVVSGDRRFTFDRERVREIRRGKSASEEYDERAQAIGRADADGWYRLGLWARERKLERAGEAFERVLATEPDHRAARRELGYEKVADAWLSRSDAMRAKGFVLAAGEWVLPAEADRAMREGARAKATPEEERRAAEIVEALCDDDDQVREAAEGMLRDVRSSALVRPMRKALYAPHRSTRLLAAKTYGTIGDRTALPWLIHSSLYDASEEVRRGSLDAVKSFGDPDTFHPYARALNAKSPAVRVNAASALAGLGDGRGVGAILYRVSLGIGESPRSNLFVGKQESFVRDFDVEIAQAAAIGDPIIGTIRDGVILDYKVLGGSGESLVEVNEPQAYAGALTSLLGRDYGTDFKAYAKYAEEQGYLKKEQ